MGILFNKYKEPVFLKESSNAEIQLEQLKELEPQLNEEGKKIIRQDISCLEYGIAGEKNIAFELKNSHIPMYVLHDIYLERDDLSAQIDYLVFTKKVCCIIECKNLYGNITIDAKGNFVRTMYFGTHKVQEGLYSPITQNTRHLELLKKIKEDKNTGLTKLMVSSSFYDFYKSVVVLANPKTVLVDKYAPKEMKKQVIRADQLAVYLRNLNETSKEMSNSDEDMEKWARTTLSYHKENTTDYLKKYEQYKLENNACSTNESEKQPDPTVCPRCGGKLIKRKGKFGEFLGCENFPKCRFTQNLD